MTDDIPRQWWPEDWLDEINPPGRATPSDFVIKAGSHFWLGYALDAEDVDEQDKRYFSKPLSIGDVVEFCCCDDLGEIEVAIYRDRNFFVRGGAQPRRRIDQATHFWLAGNSDTLASTLAEFVRDYEFDEMSRSTSTTGVEYVETIKIARWSDAIPHKLVATFNPTGKIGGAADSGLGAEFVTISQAEARQ
jgi:hypothetical protein